jgi:hypothetical protein
MEKLKLIENFIFNDEVQDILSKINDNMMNFNILEITGMGDYEIRHSNILSWLFGANEHNLKYEILDSFLKKVLEQNNLDTDKKNKLKSYLYLQNQKRNIIIYREKDNIDLLIVDEINQIVFVIENKVYADERVDGDDGGQLKKYEKNINKNYKYYDKYYIFLTIDLQKPSQKSWLVANYQMIADIIENILNIKELTQKTKIVLESYVDLLKRRGIVADKNLEELCKQIWANKEYREAIEILNKYQPGVEELLKKLRENFDKKDIYDFRNTKTDFAIFTTNWKKVYPNYTKFEEDETIGIYFGFYIVKSSVQFWVRLRDNADEKSKKYFNKIKKELDRTRNQTGIDIYASNLISNFDIYNNEHREELIGKFIEILNRVDKCFR